LKEFAVQGQQPTLSSEIQEHCDSSVSYTLLTWCKCT